MSTTTPVAAPLIRLVKAPTEPARSHRPLLHSIDEALGVIFIDLLAVDDAPAVIQALQRARLHRGFRRELSACIDCRYLSRAPHVDNLRAIAKLLPRDAMSDLTGRCAIVAGSSWAYGSAQTFASFAGAPFDRVRVFRDCAHALMWLRPRR